MIRCRAPSKLPPIERLTWRNLQKAFLKLPGLWWDGAQVSEVISQHSSHGCQALTFKRKRFVLPDFFRENLERVWYLLIQPRIRILDHMDGLVFVRLPWGLGRWFQDSCGSTSPGFELNNKTPTRNHWSFRGGFKRFLFSPQNLGTWSNLTSIFSNGWV